MEPNFVVSRTYWSKEINLQASPSTCSPLCCVFSGRAASGSQKMDAGSPRICSFLGTCVALLCLKFFIGFPITLGKNPNYFHSSKDLHDADSVSLEANMLVSHSSVKEASFCFCKLYPTSGSSYLLVPQSGMLLCKDDFLLFKGHIFSYVFPNQPI